MYFKYSDGSLIQLVKARYSRTDPQELTTYHVPLTDINGAIPLGLNWQTWTISGVIADPMSVRWRDIIWLSLDNVSWRACRVQATAFPTNMYQQSLYELTMLVSPILEGAVVRYPTTGYKWGNQSITGISQAGNVNAYPIIHYLAPLFYAPLSNTLIDFAGQAVTFTRIAPKTHNGVVYPINTPIFDAGLYLASDTSIDAITWTPPVSILKTIAMQIRKTLGVLSLLTSNQGNAGTDLTGMAAGTGTFTRNTVAPIAGGADFKLVVTANGNAEIYTDPANIAVTAGLAYMFQAFVLTSGCAAGRKANLRIVWFTAAGAYIGFSDGAEINAPTTPTTMFVAGQSPPAAAKAYVSVRIISAAVGEILRTVSLSFAGFPSILYVWDSSRNRLSIDLANSLLKWTDRVAATVGAVFPTQAWYNGHLIDIVLLDDTAHAVTVIAHASGETWNIAGGTLAALTWLSLGFSELQGSISNLIEYGYVLTDAEYQMMSYSSLSLLYNTLYVGNRYAGEIIKGSDKRLLNAAGSDISALLGGTDIPIGASAVTIAQSQGLVARWFVELKRTDV